MQQDRLVLALQKLECLDQQWNIVAIDGAVVAEAELLEDHAGQEQVLHALLDFVREFDRARDPRLLR